MKSYKIAVLLFLVGAICSVFYIYSGQTILADGTLKENFGFIPLSFLFYSLSLVFLFFTIIPIIFKYISNYINKHKTVK